MNWVWLLLFFSLVLLSGILFFLLQPWFDAQRCEQIIKKNSATFYKAFSTIKDKKRKQSIFAVYAFCRYVDDIIDEEKNPEKLHQAEIDLKAFVEQRTAKNFFYRELKKVARRFYSKPEHFKPYFDMMQGQRMDSQPVLIKHMNELLQYCDWVASSVGLMLLPILAPQQFDELTPFAIHLGRAFQLTNILRDVGEDFKRDRIYLPSDLLRQFDVNLTTIMEGRIDSPFIALWEYLAKIAEEYYALALQDLKKFPRDTQFPLAVALFFYRAILDACRQQKYDVIHHKHYVKDDQKMKLLKEVQIFLGA